MKRQSLAFGRGSLAGLTLILGLTFAGLAMLAPLAQAAPSVAFRSWATVPRTAAMGGNLVCLLTDESATDSNPARLVYGTRTASVHYDRVDPDIELWSGRLGAAFPLGPDAAEPLQLTRPRRSAAGVAIDVTGLTLIEGSGYNETSLTAGYGYTIVSFLAVGIAARYNHVFTNSTEIGANGYGVDIGLSADLSDHVDAALSIRDAFGRVTFDGGDDEDLPAQLTVGVAMARRRWYEAELNYVFQENHTAAWSLGGEVHVMPGTLDLRAGVARETLGTDRTLPSVGLGVSWNMLRMDYAFVSDSDAGRDATHRLGLLARF
ncbi:MAG: hypothetical protein ACREOU_05570 [Candidatus Eiseniibacteriota bacterium]